MSQSLPNLKIIASKLASTCGSSTACLATILNRKPVAPPSPPPLLQHAELQLLLDPGSVLNMEEACSTLNTLRLLGYDERPH